MKMIDLTQMANGEEGEVVEIQGGYGLVSRLEALGIMIGTKVKKVSSQFMRGPITIQAGNTQVAIGYDKAKKVIIKKI